MKRIKYIIYRYLTNVDFFNIYKPTGTETKGGGQRYIDFPTTSGISRSEWDTFFSKVKKITKTQVTNGNCWGFPVFSMRIPSASEQILKIYQRRPASFAISAQNINAKNSARVLAWHPKFGFPEPNDPENRQQLPKGLAIYLAHTDDGEIWAGWFQGTGTLPPEFNRIKKKDLLKPLFDPIRKPGDAGFISYKTEKVYIDN